MAVKPSASAPTPKPSAPKVEEITKPVRVADPELVALKDRCATLTSVNEALAARVAKLETWIRETGRLGHVNHSTLADALRD